MKQRKKMPPIGAGSMADIAFLLLVFFLVTATIETEAGLMTTLPAWDDRKDSTKVFEDNVLTIRMNANDEMQVEGKPTTPEQLKIMMEDFVFHQAQSPQEAIVSIESNEGTSYEMYIAVYDAVKAGYKELWDGAANKKYGMHYDALPELQQKEVFNQIPLVISETEPAKSIVKN